MCRKSDVGSRKGSTPTYGLVGYPHTFASRSLTTRVGNSPGARAAKAAKKVTKLSSSSLPAPVIFSNAGPCAICGSLQHASKDCHVKPQTSQIDGPLRRLPRAEVPAVRPVTGGKRPARCPGRSPSSSQRSQAPSLTSFRRFRKPPGSARDERSMREGKGGGDINGMNRVDA